MRKLWVKQNGGVTSCENSQVPEFNSRQRRWMELIKDYNFMIDYHLGKSNVVADAFVIIKLWYRSGRIDSETGDVEPSARGTKEK